MTRFLPPWPAPLADASSLEATLVAIQTLLQSTLDCRRTEAEDGGDFQQHLATLRDAHQSLEAAALPVSVTQPEISLDEARQAFAAGALRLKYYRQTVLARRPLIDTAGSQTLSEYSPDLHARDQSEAERWRADVARACEWTPQQLDALEAKLLPDEFAAIALRKRIMDALVQVLDLSHEPQRGAYRLLEALFPGQPLRYPEVDLICTAASIYLCLPYRDDRWTTRGPEQEQDPALVAFLRQVSRPLQTTMAHFPAFAPLNAEAIDSNLVRQLARHCGQAEADVRSRLCTMITLLPTPLIDQYIIHDVWGHQWQAHLFRFEEAYIRVATMGEEPAPTEAMHRALVLNQQGSVEAAQQLWTEALEDLLQNNHLDSLTGLVAEVFADAVEYKYLVLHPERRGQLLSSSYFKELPTKLDLTLADLPLYFRFAQRGLLSLARPQRLQALRQRLLDAYGDSLDAAALDQGLQALSGWTAAALKQPQWQRSLNWQRGKGQLQGNAFVLVALEFCRFQLAFNRLHQRLDRRAQSSPHPLLDRYHDLLIFATASFFESDRERNFWRLSEFVEQQFLPLYDRLIGAPTQATLWHNPRCSKSRQALALLHDRGLSPEVFEYLKTPANEAALKQLLRRLGIQARQLMRTDETIYRERGLGQIEDEDQLIAAMAADPILIQRPILVCGERAMIGRPPEALLELFGEHSIAGKGL